MRKTSLVSLMLMALSALSFVGCSDDAATPPPAATKIKFSQISTGGAQSYGDQQPGGHTCAIDTDGALWCWGSNDFGQLGDGTYVSSHKPIQVGTDSDWLAVDAKGNHTCGIRGTDGKGTLWCWGQNTKLCFSDYCSGDQNFGDPGLLGLGSAFDDVRSVPTVTQVGTNKDWAQVGLGMSHSCGIRDNGTDQTLWCWGANSNGAVPVGSSGSGDFENEPRREDGNFTDWSFVAGSAVGYESNMTVAIRNNDEVWASGYGGYGLTGGSSMAVSTLPGTDWKKVEVSGNESWCGIKTGGTLYCAGYNIHGAAGQGSFADVGAAAQVGTSTKWTDIAVGRQSSCGVSDGKLYCWGRDHFGELGLGKDPSSHTACVDQASAHGYTVEGKQWDCKSPVIVDSAKTWVSVDSGRSHSCALTDEGDAYCWGFNAWGQTGQEGPEGVWEPALVN